MTEKDFGTLPVTKIFFKLSIPNIMSTLFMSLYVMADGIFVGKCIGAGPLAAVNLVWPVLCIVFALSDMVAIGSAVKVSTALGAGEEDRARRLFSAAIAISVAIGLPFLIFAGPFLREIFALLFKDAELAELSYQYARYFVYFFPLLMPLFALDNFMRISGKANYSMGVNVGVSVLNIVLDWLFIYVLGLDIRWAAIASVISMLTGLVLSLLPFLLRKVTLHFVRPAISLKDFRGVIYNGSSEFFGNTTGSIMSVIINGVLLTLGGSLAVAGYSIVMYIDTLLVGILYALGDAVQPAVSYNAGAGKMKRSEAFFKICGITAAAASLICMAVIMLFPEQLVSAFAEKGERALIDMSAGALMLFAPSYLFKWFNMLSSSFLTALDRPRESIIIMFFQAVACPALCLAVLAPLYGTDGVFFAHSASAALTCLAASVIWKRSKKHRLKKTDKA